MHIIHFQIVVVGCTQPLQCRLNGRSDSICVLLIKQTSFRDTTIRALVCCGVSSFFEGALKNRRTKYFNT